LIFPSPRLAWHVFRVLFDFVAGNASGWLARVHTGVPVHEGGWLWYHWPWRSSLLTATRARGL